ncbi:MAG TPA: tRNA (cytidine(34)-2'-O)-methyltransferase [Allosphingosinicella sp.]|nr:tRNA (cytidine(34)-2'-O)-methyltransferase [Allosphingosinicella sp.]
MRLALYQPDQAGNVGTILRLAACLGVPVDIVEPCGFPWSDKALRRAGMDYAEIAEVTRHADWDAFAEARAGARLVLMTTQGATPLPQARFEAGDILLMGSESSGVPAAVHAVAALRVRIPQVEGTRSLNIAVAAGIGLAEAIRQAGLWPGGVASSSAV